MPAEQRDASALTPEVPATPNDSDNEPAKLTGITSEQVQAIISSFRTQRISVAALLASARSWLLEEERLVIGFADNFAAHTLETDREVIQRAAMEVLGRNTLRVEIVVDGAGGADDQLSAPVAEHVEMVRRVFRGEVVEEQ